MPVLGAIYTRDARTRARAAAYPGATWARLAAIKARYDPGNLFRPNETIAPASARTCF